MLLDLHVYTNISGGLPLAQAISDAKRAGLGGICVADRHASAAAARAVSKGETGDFPVMIAVEIATRSGDALLVVPELDPFYTREEWKAATTLARPSVADLQRFAETKGGVVLIGHPYDRSREMTMGDRVFTLNSVAGVELSTWGADASSNALALEAVSNASVPSFGGSAARKGAGNGPRWATLFSADFTDQAGFVEALQKGDFWPVELMGAGAPGGSKRRRPEPRGDSSGRPRRPSGGGGGSRGRR